MFSVPEGRAANQPFAVTTLRPPMAALFPGARVSFAVISSPARRDSLTSSGDNASNFAFWAGLAGQFTEVLAGITARTRGNLRSEQPEDRPVFVGGPYGSITAQETRPGALLAAKTKGPFKQPFHKP